jgi:hypothetical protein
MVQPGATINFWQGDERGSDLIRRCYFSAPPKCGSGEKCYKKEHFGFLSLWVAKK